MSENNDLIQWPRAKWWEVSWSPVIGCHKVSPACANCWACEWAKRFKQSFEPHRSSKKTPPNKGVVFAGGLTDLFGDWLSIEESASFITTAAIRAMSTDPTYIWLTKRVERMERALNLIDQNFTAGHWLKNHYFGFTAENQEWFDIRCRNMVDGWAETYGKPKWQNTWVSCEPLLGPIDLTTGGLLEIMSWIVVGCESGPNRRPCNIGWVESIVEQCLAANVPVFVKQLSIGGKCETDINKFPEHLRIRQVPWAKEGGEK